MKVCRSCQKEKPLSEFYKNKLTSTGVGAWCKLCDTLNRRKQRRDLKDELIKEMGGKCVRCGYTKCIWALEFHHLDRSTKDMLMNQSYSPTRMKAEAKKCILVCSNCHREIEYGLMYKA